MPRLKGSKNKKTTKAETKKAELTPKQKLVELLLIKVPTCFDRDPRGSMSRSAVEKLADEIIK